MTTLIERLRRYKRDRSGYAEYCHQAADEIEKLTRELANAQVSGIHSCHADCTRSGCVNGRLREQLEDEYNRGYQAAMQRQATEVDALIAQWPRATPKGKK